jgi:hypothetical protein
LPLLDVSLALLLQLLHVWLLVPLRLWLLLFLPLL